MSVRTLTDDLHRTLTAAQCDRAKRREWVDTDIGREPGWVRHERRVMFDEVNRLRAERGKPPVSIDSVKRVENLAYGHSDYSRKFAFGCAELVEVSGDGGPRE